MLNPTIWIAAFTSLAVCGGYAMPQDSTAYYRIPPWDIASGGNKTFTLVGMGIPSTTSILGFNSTIYSNGPAINVDPLIRPAGNRSSRYRDRGGAEYLQNDFNITLSRGWMWSGAGNGHSDGTTGGGLFSKSEYSGTTSARGWVKVRYRPPATPQATLSQPFAVRRSVIPIGSSPEGHLWISRQPKRIPLAELGISPNRILHLQALYRNDDDSKRMAYNQAAHFNPGAIAAFSVRGAEGGNFTFDLNSASNEGYASKEYNLNRGYITVDHIAADCSDGAGPLPASTNVGNRQVSAYTWNGTAYVSTTYAGCHGHSNGTYVLESTGNDIYNNNDQFRFAHVAGNGNKELKVRVDQLENTNGWARAGLMLREGTAANARNVAVFVTAGNGIIFQARTSSAYTSTLATASTSIAKAPVWLRLRYDAVNDVTRAYYSSNGSTWIQVGSSQFLIAHFGNYQMGLAAASRSNYPNTSVYSNLTMSNTLGAP